ncbi:hypothetical protein [Thermocatellispora tengchongensis]|uniref:hypothetical protein n=1 Tax=Thermocatellispora tengchongensis TaxID=1073253 RepID=UPI00363A66EE
MTIQLSSAGEKPRSFWMAGIATVTMLPSRIVISPVADSTPSAVQRELRTYDMVSPVSGRQERP